MNRPYAAAMRPVFKLLWPFVLNGSVTNHTLYTKPFYGLFLGLHGWVLLQFNGAREDNRDRDIDHPAGRHSARTNQRPTSIIPPIFTPDALPDATLPTYPGLGQAQEYAGLHTPIHKEMQQFSSIIVPCPVFSDNNASIKNPLPSLEMLAACALHCFRRLLKT